MTKLLLSIALVLLAAFVFWKLTRYFWLKIYYRCKGVQDVDVSTAHDWQKFRGAFLLDVREPFEYDEAHVEGVTLIPVGQLAERAGELAHLKDQCVLIICRGGVRSAKASLILSGMGFKSPLNVAGGMNDWKKFKLPFISKNISSAQ